MNKTGFFEEKPGNRSANRLIYIIGMIWLMAISTIQIITKSANILEISTFFAMASGVFSTAKLIQKKQEISNQKKSQEND